MQEIERRGSNDWEGFRDERAQRLAQQMIKARDSYGGDYPGGETLLVLTEKAKKMLLDENTHGTDRDLARKVVETGIEELLKWKGNEDIAGDNILHAFDTYMARPLMSEAVFSKLKEKTIATLTKAQNDLQKLQRGELVTPDVFKDINLQTQYITRIDALMRVLEM
ncbi:MAG: hypothetical protein G01um10148_880 [Parcubacteria group bacterium Gr01-1014_8]|nr:MAG: hypothetical protein G01um10148_880 [Parcubacteria group bacterium Gr01-1014_8]